MSKLFRGQNLVWAGLYIALATSASALAQQQQPPQITVENLIGQAVSDSNNPQYQDIADAIPLFQSGNVNAARELLERARRKNAKLPPSEVLLARMLLGAGQLTPARAELERSAMNNPDDPEAYLLFAELALRDGRITDAEALYSKCKTLTDAFKENGKRQRNFNLRLNSGLAGVWEQREQWDKVIQFLKAWLELDPDSATAHQRIGRALFKQGNDKDAYAEFQTAVKLEPEMMNADVVMAHMYEDAKNREQAAKFIQAAVKKNSTNLKVLLDALAWALVTNRMTEAQGYADAALKIDPKSIDAMVMRGQIARMAGDFKTAETMLEQAHSQAPSNLDASNQLALTLADEKDPKKLQKALEIAEMNVKVSAQGNQFNAEAATTLAWVYYRMGKLNDAEQVLNRILQRGVLNADIAYYVAKILQERGRVDDAIKLLQVSLNNPAPFVLRQNSTDLLTELNAKKAEAPAASK